MHYALHMWMRLVLLAALGFTASGCWVTSDQIDDKLADGVAEGLTGETGEPSDTGTPG